MHYGIEEAELCSNCELTIGKLNHLLGKTDLYPTENQIEINVKDIVDTKNSITFNQFPKDAVLIDNLSVKFMKQACFIPLELSEKALRIAIADIRDTDTLEALQLAFGIEIVPVAGKRDDIIEAIERLYGAGSKSIETIIDEAGKEIFEVKIDAYDDIDHLRDMASEAPIIRLVNRLISNAVDILASDIHFEPFEDEFKIRYRIDGVLHEVESPPKSLQPAIISRVKIMSKLDIAERRLPQDGRIKLKIREKEIDFRVSTIPTLYGESVVMRILDRGTLILDLTKIGFPQDMLSQYEELIRQPYGMILVTGPTGSGKTSTLYTTLAKITSSENKIITLEDPVEYQLKGVNQIQVAPKIGLSFSNGLRSIVRQDPDIILVGEIRDRETAEIAIQSALTGHLLFSTLHTNDAPGAITRLLDMKVEPYLLSATLLGVLAQRLVRVICGNCKDRIDPDLKKLMSMRLPEEEFMQIEYFEGRGCDFCRGTGFHGRTAIFEFLKVDENIRMTVTKQLPTDEIKRIAIRQGLRTLRQDGWDKVKRGITTIDEVLRVTLEI